MLVGGEEDVGDGSECQDRQSHQNTITVAPQRINEERREEEKLKVRRQVPCVPQADVVRIHKVLNMKERCIPIVLTAHVVKLNHELVVRSVAEIALK